MSISPKLKRWTLTLLCVAVTLTSEISAAGRAERHEMIRGRPAAAREVLVRFRQPASKIHQAGVAATEADIELDTALGDGRWRRVRSRGRSAEALASAMRARADVEYAEPNYVLTLSGWPNDLGTSLWGLHNSGQRLESGETGTPGADIGAVAAWDITQGSRRIVVATIDTGVMMTHRDLAANLWTAPRAFSVLVGGTTITCAAGTHGFNAITRTCDPGDDHGHGTHVAGSIGAVGNNGTGVVGVNWTTSIMALKFMNGAGVGYISDAIDAIEFAMQAKQAFAASGDADVRVLNNSWSGGAYSQALNDQIQRASGAGMLFVVAAGNGSVDHDVTPVYPADYPGANVLSVAASDYRDRLGWFSDFSPRRVHVAAPGVLIYSTTRSQTDPMGSYGTLSGTSMAAAYVSGVAALVLSHCPYSTGALRDAIVRTAVRVPSLAGRVQSEARINAAAAVRSCDAISNGPSDIVIYAADVPAGDRHGAWTLRTDSSAAGGFALITADLGWSSTATALAHPTDYFDVRFPAQGGVPYRLWLRLRATGDSKWNDSVWVQFSDARVNGAPADSINTATGLGINLENCNACGTGGWGWQDGSYWLPRRSIVFGSTGTQTMRIQTREDGVQIDQIVLSSSTWTRSAPGQVTGDTTMVPKAPPPAASGSAPFSGAPIAIPGTMQAEDFDQGGEGVAYHDDSPGNSGGGYRAGDVDILVAADGRVVVGWVTPGEWLAYTVNVATTGSYVVQFRVASRGPGGRFHMEVGGVDVTGSQTIPTTGGWLVWQTLTLNVALRSGKQVAKLVMESGTPIGNFDAITFTASPATALPVRINAVDFLDGPEGVAYHDTTSGNTGGALRPGDVDIETSSEGGYNVGWIAAGEWLRYTVDVPHGGPHIMVFRVASRYGGGSLHAGFGASIVTGRIDVPATGAWQNWTSVSVPVTLAAGRQQMTLVFEAKGFNIRYVELTPTGF